MTCQMLTCVEAPSGTEASRNPIKFNKMYKEVPHLGQNNAMRQGRLGTVWLSSSSPGEDLEVAVDVRSSVSQWCAHCKWGKLHVGLLLKKGGQQIEETHYPRLLKAGNVTPGILCLALGPPGQEGIQKWEGNVAEGYRDGQGHGAHASGDGGGCGFSVWWRGG